MQRPPPPAAGPQTPTAQCPRSQPPLLLAHPLEANCLALRGLQLEARLRLTARRHPKSQPQSEDQRRSAARPGRHRANRRRLSQSYLLSPPVAVRTERRRESPAPALPLRWAQPDATGRPFGPKPQQRFPRCPRPSPRRRLRQPPLLLRRRKASPALPAATAAGRWVAFGRHGRDARAETAATCAEALAAPSNRRRRMFPLHRSRCRRSVLAGMRQNPPRAQRPVSSRVAAADMPKVPVANR